MSGHTLQKRSVVIDGHRTSISLEDGFFAELQRIASRDSKAVNGLVSEISRGIGEGDGNLSSAIRCYVLQDLITNGIPQKAEAA